MCEFYVTNNLSSQRPLASVSNISPASVGVNSILYLIG